MLRQEGWTPRARLALPPLRFPRRRRRPVQGSARLLLLVAEADAPFVSCVDAVNVRSPVNVNVFYHFLNKHRQMFANFMPNGAET